MKRGIYLVANRNSEVQCENLLHSIRKSGCRLPVRLIHFGGEKITSRYLLDDVAFLQYKDFPEEAKAFIQALKTVLTDCPEGYLYRYLAWFSDWDEFIYSDNDIVALSNWENLLAPLSEHDLVHADQEFKTKGKYNYEQPEQVCELFGSDALDTAFTAGHFAARRNSQMLKDFAAATDWFHRHPHIPKKHDQAFLHIASLLGGWRMLNLCKPPHNWLSTWAGDYGNVLELVQAVQANDAPRSISHLHYSGGQPSGLQPIEEFLFAYGGNKSRLQSLVWNGCLRLSGISYLSEKRRRLLRRLKA